MTSATRKLLQLQLQELQLVYDKAKFEAKAFKKRPSISNRN